MTEFDADTLADQAVLIGLVSRQQVREARDEAADGSAEALGRVLTRKGLLTSWQYDRLQKGDGTGFFYGGCRVLFHIAEGTFARVYRGRREPGGQSVAIKVLRRRFCTDQAAVSRFNQEAEAGLKLVHENIVRIYDYGAEDNNYYMLMEYVEGMNLRDFLKIRHRIEHDQALPLMFGMAEGLKYSLEHGVTHRDIKGTNILVSNRGEAKLVDFGLATIGDERSMETAHGQRTVDYSALERTCGSPKGDPRSDIYFLGCVYYQMITGVLPLPEVESSDPLAKMLKRSFGAIKPLADHRYAPPAELTRIITKMMEMNLTKRYQTMDEVLKDLRAYKERVDEAKQAGISVARMDDQPAGPSEDDFLDELFGRKSRKKGAVARNVLCVEAQEGIRDALRKSLSGLGYRVLLVSDAEVGAERFNESAPDVVVYDVDGLGPEAIDTFLYMREKAQQLGKTLSAVVLLGPRQAALGERLPAGDARLLVLNKPLKMKDVTDAVGQLAPAG